MTLKKKEYATFNVLFGIYVVTTVKLIMFEKVTFPVMNQFDQRISFQAQHKKLYIYRNIWRVG